MDKYAMDNGCIVCEWYGGEDVCLLPEGDLCPTQIIIDEANEDWYDESDPIEDDF